MKVTDITEKMQFNAQDFSDSRYKGVFCHNRKQQPPVVLMMSESCNPAHWMIIDGMKQMFYLRYADAMDYLHRMGYTPNNCTQHNKTSKGEF